MTIVNVSFGIFAFLPQGWLFMAFVILFEWLLVSKLLTNRWDNLKIFIAVTASNAVSGIAGIITSLWLNGGWYLVVWFPWISSNELDVHNNKAVQNMVIFYLAAFVFSIFIETIINVFFLRKEYKTGKIIKITLLANIATYTIGSFVMYSYSFR